MMLSLFGVLLATQIAAASKPLRLAVVIGNNHGHRQHRPLRYAERDARKMYEALTRFGGFSRDRSVLLLGRSAAQVRQTLQQLDRRTRAARQAGRRSLLLVYYSGHADGHVLELGQDELSFNELKGFLRASGADVRLAFVDSCQSGRLVAHRGGRRAPPYQIRVADEIASSGYVVVTSSAADELSQESEEVRGSYFTHYLVSALHGAADRSGDGHVTLDEAYRFVYAHTLARTSATFAGSQHPMYDFRLAGRGEIVLASTRGRTQVTVASKRRGRLIAVLGDGDAISAESSLRPEAPVTLALAPGSYRLYMMQQGVTWSAPVALQAGDTKRLTDASFRRHTLRRSIAKGGLLRPRWGHRLDAGLLMRNSPIASEDGLVGGAVIYRAEHPSGWRPLVRLQSSAAAAFGANTGLFDIGLLAGIGYALPMYRFGVYAELLSGYEHLVQSPDDGRRHTPAFSYLAMLGVELPLQPFVLGLSAGMGGRVLKLREGRTTHRIDAQGLLTIGWVISEGRR